MLSVILRLCKLKPGQTKYSPAHATQAARLCCKTQVTSHNIAHIELHTFTDYINIMINIYPFLSKYIVWLKILHIL